MKISELEARLAALKETHGDVRVLVTESCRCCFWHEEPHARYIANFDAKENEYDDEEREGEPTVLLV